MADISKIKIGGTVYKLKDAQIRTALGIVDYATNTAYSKGDYLYYNGNLYIVNADITAGDNTQFSDLSTSALDVNADINAKYNELKGLIAGGVHYRGVTSTALYDGYTNPDIDINDDTYTAEAGDLVIYQDEGSSTGVRVDREFIWSGEVWNEFGAGIGTFGQLAFVDSAFGSVNTIDSIDFENGAAEVSADYTPEGSVEVTLGTLTQTPTEASIDYDDYTPQGTVAVTLGTLTQTPTEATLTKEDYTPAGSVEVTLTPTATAAELTKGDYTPQGSVSNITVIDSVGTLPTLSAAATATFATEGITADIDETDTEMLVFTVASTTVAVTAQGTFDQGSLPTTKVVTPTFTGTTAPSLIVTGVSYDKMGVQSAAFTGTTAPSLIVTGVSYNQAEANGATASFTGTLAENVIAKTVTYNQAEANGATASFTGTAATITSTGTVTGGITYTSTDKTITVTADSE